MMGGDSILGENIMAMAHQVTHSSGLNIKKIAVLTDFSRNAENALRFASTFARTYKAGILLAHASIPPPSVFAAPKADLVYKSVGAWRQRLESCLLTDAQAAFLRDVTCTIVLHEGDTAGLVKQLGDVDLIVVGTSGKTGLRKAALGSTAEMIFRSSPVPVLTVGPHCNHSGTGRRAFESILYATDFSPGAAAALPYAMSIARECDGRLVLLHVADDKGSAFSFVPAMARSVSMDKLHELVPESNGLKYSPTYIVGFGPSAATIVEQAEDCKANLIVVGARGSGALAPAVSHLSGGTAYYVAAHASCPVLTIRDRVALTQA
jgi:nucleotide-binding universal stress UspA family protein